MYIKITNGKAKQYTLRQLHKENPKTSFPEKPTSELLAKWSVYPYSPTPEPEYDMGLQVVEHKGYIESGGTYSDTYVIRDKTDAELATDLDKSRSLMQCSKMQAMWFLGADEWGKVISFRDHVDTTWVEKLIIDNPQDWNRVSQDTDLLAYILGYSTEQMDHLFTQAHSLS
jgi:hypothetical protein